MLSTLQKGLILPRLTNNVERTKILKSLAIASPHIFLSEDKHGTLHLPGRNHLRPRPFLTVSFQPSTMLLDVVVKGSEVVLKEVDGLQPGWQLRFDPQSGRFFYYHLPTKFSSSQPSASVQFQRNQQAKQLREEALDDERRKRGVFLPDISIEPIVSEARSAYSSIHSDFNNSPTY